MPLSRRRILQAGGALPFLSISGRAQRASNGWLAPSGSYERRPVGGGFSSGRRSDLLDPDDEEDDQVSGGPLAAEASDDALAKV